MEYRRLGQSDMMVSVVSMGCWSIVSGDWWGSQDEDEAVAAIEKALDLGVNFFDTAEGYGAGASEELLGRVLEGRRSEAIITTKVSRRNLAAADIVAACERSLKRLRTDYIDLYQIHWPNREIPFEETMPVLERLRDQGKIRAIGVSNFGPLDMTDLLALGRYESNQVPYNLLWRAIEFEIQPQCAANQISILPYSPLQQGLLAGKFASVDDIPEPRTRTRQFSSERPGAKHGEPGCEQEMFAALKVVRQISEEVERPMAQVALAWLLYQPGVTSVVAGARNPAQVIENTEAATLELSSDILERLDRATQDMKVQLGSNPDMWASESNYR